MKNKSSRIIITLLCGFVFGLGSCNKPSELGPGSPIIYGLIYKTKNDYFENIDILPKHYPYSTTSLSKGLSIEDGDTLFAGRMRLDSGYVLTCFVSVSSYFTNVRFADLVTYYEKHQDYFPKDSMLKRVIDKDPFLEYYIDTAFLTSWTPEGFAAINEIIENSELDKYFKRVK